MLVTEEELREDEDQFEVMTWFAGSTTSLWKIFYFTVEKLYTYSYNRHFIFREWS